MSSNETESSFVINNFGRINKEVPSTAKIVCFKMISNVKTHEVARIWGISPDKYKRIMESDSSDQNLSLYETKIKLLDAVEQISRMSKQSFQDEYGQIAASNVRPHKKYSSSGFKVRMGNDRDECIESCSSLPSATAGNCPIFKIYYEISESEYDKEMKIVKKRREEIAKKSVEYYENLDKLTPERDKSYGEALEKVLAIRQSVEESEKIHRPDPDLKDNESIFSDSEQKSAQRRLRSQIQPIRPF